MDTAATWVDNHPGIVFPVAITAALKGNEGPIEEDGALLEKSFFDGASYSDKVLQQMEGGFGEFHSFPESVTAFEDSGTATQFVGGDGQIYNQLNIPGSYQSAAGNWYDGEFQFIQDSNGVINHRFFSPF